MAASTAAALMTELRTDDSIDVGSPDSIEITEEAHDSATYSRYYCVGKASKYQGRSMWVRTTVSGNAGAQADEIRVAMTADTTAINHNVDPDAQS